MRGVKDVAGEYLTRNVRASRAWGWRNAAPRVRVGRTIGLGNVRCASVHARARPVCAGTARVQRVVGVAVQVLQMRRHLSAQLLDKRIGGETLTTDALLSSADRTLVARFLGSKFLLWTQGALMAWTEEAASKMVVRRKRERIVASGDLSRGSPDRKQRFSSTPGRRVGYHEVGTYQVGGVGEVKERREGRGGREKGREEGGGQGMNNKVSSRALFSLINSHAVAC